jgi:Flp pilus assembly protein TadG
MEGYMAMLFSRVPTKSKNQRGATLVLFAVLLFLLIGVAALAIDLGYLFVARNELQNAADAGALAGARELYYSEDSIPPGSTELIGTVNPGADNFGLNTATMNKSEKIAVEVTTVERGHWSLNNRTFSMNENTLTLPPDFWTKSADELDSDPDFINAVRVVTRSPQNDEGNRTSSFFSRLFGFTDFDFQKEAIAYIGFAGEFGPGEFDIPIVICEGSIIDPADPNKFTCNIGRMIDSSNDIASSNTGAWSSFEQDNSTCSAANANTIKGLVNSGNTKTVFSGRDITTQGGNVDAAFKEFVKRWESNNGNDDQPWEVTVPKVDCSGSKNVGNCPPMTGAVVVRILWLKDKQDPHFNDAPRRMWNQEENRHWESLDSDGQVRWDSFVQEFGLQNADGNPAPYANATNAIYFSPICTPHEPAGKTGSGGTKSNILAKIPVLVK